MTIMNSRHRVSGYVHVLTAALLLLPAVRMTQDGLPGSVEIAPAACDNGNLKKMTGGVGSVTCLSTIELPRPEGGEARDAEPAPEAPAAPDPAPAEEPAEENGRDR